MSLRGLSECSHAFGNASTGTIAVIAATPGRRVCIYRLVLTNAAAVAATLQDTASNALSQQFQLPAGNMPMVMETQTNSDPWFTTNAGLGVQIAQTGTVNIGYDIFYQLNP